MPWLSQTTSPLEVTMTFVLITAELYWESALEAYPKGNSVKLKIFFTINIIDNQLDTKITVY